MNGRKPGAEKAGGFGNSSHKFEAYGIVRVARVATDDNPADILFKPLLKPAFIRHCDTLMLSE